jgi:general secretion pathway protein N
LAALLAIGVGVSPSISAVPTNTSDIDAKVERRADDPSTPSVWDQPTVRPQVVTAQSAQPPSAPQRALSPNPLWEVSLEGLSSTRERPVFSPSRRPPPPVIASVPLPKEAPPPPKPPVIERPRLSLVGTITGDEESFGIFVEQTTNAALRLKLGEDYQGWKLQAVQGREVTLEHNEQTAILTLPEPGAAISNQLPEKVEMPAAARPPGPPPTPRLPGPPRRDQRP